ncbi:MAG: transposase [Tannerellaceae bacterium]|uniref:transposase n=1 Tax=Serratia sp. (in: enterobacteria) TaxID=616 RepID=UPI003EE557AC
MELTTKYADVFNSLSEFESKKLEKVVIDICKQRLLLTNDRPKFCPLCGSAEATFIKRGKLPNGKQRYFCSSCSSRFVSDVNSISYKSNQPMEVWFKVIEDTIQLKSIKHTAKELNLTDITIFRLCHKFLHALEILMQEIDLENLIEMDEVIHINTVNQLHDWFKQIYKSYRGVASKYINRYLALFSFIKRCKALELSEIKSLLYTRIKERQTYVTNRQVHLEHLATAI